MSRRTDELLDRLSLDEKASLTAGADMWHSAGCERLGIPGLAVTDGPNGARGSSFVGTTSACAPCGTALGATWNAELVRRVGEVLGRETRSKGADLLLAPTVNIHRAPLAGRNFECYSEDPYLTARLAVAYIEGVQSTGVGCAVKHLVGNDSEHQRHTISSEIDDRALREIYLPPFEAAVTEARSMSIMTAYNRLAGVYCAEHPRLMEILFDEWGFDGFVISDWWGVQSTIGTGRHGCDLEMPGPATHLGPKLAEAVLAGELDEDALDAKVRRLLVVSERLGLLERSDPGPERSEDRPEDREVLRAAAREAIVLLANRGALPLLPSEIGRLAVIGPNADASIVQGGGSASVNPHRIVTVLDGIRARYEPVGVEVLYQRGLDSSRTAAPLQGRHCGPAGIAIQYFAGTDLRGAPIARQQHTSGRLVWLGDPLPGVRAGEFSVRMRAEYTATTAGDHELALVVGGRGRLLCDGDEVLEMWDRFVAGSSFFGMGSEEIRVGVPFEAGQTRVFEAEFSPFPGLPMAGFQVGMVVPDEGIEGAVAAAGSADAAVVVVGLDADWETEGQDRASWDLPGRQSDLILAVAAVNPRTVVLVNAGAPVDLGWEDRVGAVAQIWYLGQEGGDAVADVLSGDVSPSGRLPTTLPVTVDDNPTAGDPRRYPGVDGRVHYDEGLLVGYRHYDAAGIEPRFPFGHGLAYTTFEYGDLHVEQDLVRVTVTNVGPCRGAEVVQLYVAPIDLADRPPQELKGFVKLDLAPGESDTAVFHLDRRSFAHWDVGNGGWRIAPGRYALRAGSSSRDIRATATVSRTG